jgi:GNAT superfamily N-acetyltransferase
LIAYGKPKFVQARAEIGGPAVRAAAGGQLAGDISIQRMSNDRAADRPMWTAVGELCCRTGNDGDPISRERWDLFERIWIEPYRELAPEWCYVALADRRVVGYLTGCPDTSSFARQCFVRCTVPLLWQIMIGRHHGDAYGKRFARQVLGLEANVVRSFPRSVRRRLPRDFPAHLHMNVDAGFRRAGVGTRLVEYFVADLRQRQVSGVHLFCGGKPVPFYKRMGFDELAMASVRGYPVHAMILRV